MLKSDLIQGGRHGYTLLPDAREELHRGQPTLNNAAHLPSTHLRSGLEIRQTLTLLSGKFFLFEHDDTRSSNSGLVVNRWRRRSSCQIISKVFCLGQSNFLKSIDTE